jgi:hypothetical protein
MNPLTILLQSDLTDEVVQQSPIAELLQRLGPVVLGGVGVIVLILLAIWLLPRLFSATQRCSVTGCNERAVYADFSGKVIGPATLCYRHGHDSVRVRSPEPAPPKEA